MVHRPSCASPGYELAESGCKLWILCVNGFIIPLVSRECPRRSVMFRHLAPGLAFVGKAGNTEHVFQLDVLQLGDIDQAFRVTQSVLENGFTLRNQPAAEIIEAIVRTAPIDNVGGGPELVSVGQ